MIDNKREQLEAIDGQIETDGEFEAQRIKVAGIDLSTQALQELNLPELVDTWSQLEEDFIFLKWKLAMLISDKFNSKKELGRFLQDLRRTNPHSALCTINTSTFYRYTRAARFCDKFKIYNLKEFGIPPTAIYDLSEKKNEPVVDDRFIQNIKNTNLPVSEIKQLISQAHSISGELIPEPIQTSKKPAKELPAQDSEPLQAIDNEMRTMHDVIEGHGMCVEPAQSTSQPVTLHVEPTNQLTNEGMVQEVLNVVDRFNLSYDGMFNLLMTIMAKIQESRTGIPVSRINIQFLD